MTVKESPSASVSFDNTAIFEDVSSAVIALSLKATGIVLSTTVIRKFFESCA